MLAAAGSPATASNDIEAPSEPANLAKGTRKLPPTLATPGMISTDGLVEEVEEPAVSAAPAVKHNLDDTVLSEGLSTETKPASHTLTLSLADQVLSEFRRDAGRR